MAAEPRATTRNWQHWQKGPVRRTKSNCNLVAEKTSLDDAIERG
jgi:hypothetical protein